MNNEELFKKHYHCTFITPTKEQEIQISKTFGCCRFVYNQLLAKKIELYKNEQKSLSKTDCNNYCNQFLKKQKSLDFFISWINCTVLLSF